MLSNEEKIDSYDVLIYISPYDVFPECLNVERRKARQFIIHVPYSYYLVSKDDAIYNEPFYERTIFKIAWLVCAANDMEVQIAKEHQRLEAYNYEFTGFPKMDIFYEQSHRISDDLWWKKEIIKIIWAPHFNMIKGMNGTFYYNFKWFLNYAREHKEISWIVRPHPRFASGAIAAGVFSNLNEVNSYFNEWENLPNARGMDGGDYHDIFVSSDAMILDSISFLAEYQFTGKPLLFLYPEIPRGMNKLGSKLLDVVYKSRGDDFETIEKFINIVKDKDDHMYNLRRSFFDSQLNFVIKNGKLATEYIWNKIESLR